jgi:hypothetical protein
MSLWLMASVPSANAAAPSEVRVEQGRIQGIAAWYRNNL